MLLSLTKLISSQYSEPYFADLFDKHLCNMLTADNAYIADIFNTDKVFSFLTKSSQC